ncbi:uncharacterized protein KY384_006683 [Bacidia gigantensis]|uniref:uncharacterized protein n=1 Tax=Bacidia gigantensis TaxID=2732470 RepID=UPI001D03BC2D|nr:uncharacterized protein KY384_006683 [Bacidia gigantensis]KAG8528994.1 hypothetical protein KY384_006683 [Bacidia gigantensis]
MPDPSHLPAELFDAILRYVGCGDKFRNDALDREVARLQQLYHCCLVDRTWHKIVLPRLYTQFVYRGQRGPSPRLLSFLGSVLTIPEWAKSLQRLILAFERIEDSKMPSRATGPASQDDLARLLAALHNNSPLTKTSTSFQHCREDARIPLMPLILTGPQQTSPLAEPLLDMSHALQAGFCRALTLSREQQPRLIFQNLKEVMITTDERGYNQYIHFTDVFPIFQLPNIKKISIQCLYTVNMSGNADILAAAGTSPVKELTIAHSNDCILTKAAAGALLNIPQALSALSLYYNDNSRGIWLDGPDSPTAFELLEFLLQHKNTLSYLDLYSHGVMSTSPQHYEELLHRQHPLAALSALRTLSIQSSVMSARYYRTGEHRLRIQRGFNLIDCLPASLENLTLYSNLEPDNNLVAIERELAEVVHSGTFPQLKQISLEDSLCLKDYRILQFPCRKIQGFCNETGIRLRKIRRGILPYGGLHESLDDQEIGYEAHDIEEEGFLITDEGQSVPNPWL